MIDEFDVTIESAFLSVSNVSGMPLVSLVFLPRELCFVDDRLVGKLYSRISNDHPAVGWKRAGLRRVLGMVSTSYSFTDKELRSMVGRRMRVGVEEVEFRDRVCRRVTSFLRYSGVVKATDYSDNEYVFMMREVL